MTVKELIAKLSMLAPEALIVIQKDGEGNDYSPAVDVQSCVYRAENTWSGRVLDEEDAPLEQDVNAIVIWPVK